MFVNLNLPVFSVFIKSRKNPGNTSVFRLSARTLIILIHYVQVVVMNFWKQELLAQPIDKLFHIDSGTAEPILDLRGLESNQKV